MDYVFTMPCCACERFKNEASIGSEFNDYAILADRTGHAILFCFKSMSLIHDFGNLLEDHSVSGQWRNGMSTEHGRFQICTSQSCTIHNLAVSHSTPVLMCFVATRRGQVDDRCDWRSLSLSAYHSYWSCIERFWRRTLRGKR